MLFNVEFSCALFALQLLFMLVLELLPSIYFYDKLYLKEVIHLQNPNWVRKFDEKGRRLCSWDGCTERARKYCLCKKHYKKYYEQLHSELPYRDEDIQCLNVNLSNDNLSVNGQWNHGNNK